MKISTRRFAEIEVCDEDIVHFPEGLVGLASHKQFILLQDPESTDLIWLQSLDQHDFALATIHSSKLGPDFPLEVHPAELHSLRLDSPDDLAAFLIINRIDGQFFVNLRGPIMVNAQRMIGRQVVLQDDRYGVRHAVSVSTSAPAEASSPEGTAGDNS